MLQLSQSPLNRLSVSNGVVADMHIHSTSSDGRRSPSEIVEMALQRGLSAIAISDHDTINGIDEAIEAAAGKNITIIPAIELSAVDENRSIHVLGYHFDHHNPIFKELLSDIIDHRAKRAQTMVEKLNDIGVKLTIADVKQTSSSKFLGRVHVAQAMVENGYISDRKDAFCNQYIGKGGLAYVDRYRMSVSEAISLIHKAGGWAVVAHPGGNNDDTPLNEQDFRKFIQWGLDGVEVFTFKHNPQQSAYYLRLANELDLMVTGGSDYHGKHNLNVGDFGLSKLHLAQFMQIVKDEKE